MEIINTHAHIYPNKIAERATLAIGEFYDIKMQVPVGTTSQLLEEGRQYGVSKFVVHSVATKAAQVVSINNFIIDEITLHNEFIGFMTLHPDMAEDEILDEIKRCVKCGIKGIKLHPDFQKFNIDSEEANKIYRAEERSGEFLPILLHMGDDRYDYSKPIRLVKVAKKYKNLYFIAAHFGGYRCWDDYKLYKGLDNVYFDTCSSLWFLDAEKARKIIDELGYQKFFFGDDFPMWNLKDELDRFYALNLGEKVNKAILAENFKKFIRIK